MLMEMSKVLVASHPSSRRPPMLSSGTFALFPPSAIIFGQNPFPGNDFRVSHHG
jgi:hypothetical protein